MSDRAIVLGGGLALTLISLPLQHVVGLVGVVWRVFFVRITAPTEVIERSVRMAETARAETIMALEQDVDQNKTDPFLAAGIRLAVDGTEPDLIMDILETELQFIEKRHQQARRSVSQAGRNCLAMGVLAALLGTVIGSHHGAEPGQIVFWGSLGLLYGGIAWALASAVAHKLRRYSEMEGLVKRLTIEAIMCIQSGDNPRIVQHKLSVFLQPAMRPSGEISTARPAPVPVPDDGFVQQVRRMAAEKGPGNFVFERIVDLTDKDINLLLRQVDQNSLVVALVGATEPVRARLLDSMSPACAPSCWKRPGLSKIRLQKTWRTCMLPSPTRWPAWPNRGRSTCPDATWLWCRDEG